MQNRPRWLALAALGAIVALTLAFMPLIESLAARDNLGGDTPIISLSLVASVAVVLGLPWAFLTLARRRRDRRNASS